MDKKGKQNPKTKEALEKLEAGILSLTSSDNWRDYLTFHSKFHTYSFHNIIMIWLQKPNATYVAGFNKWKELGRNVKKGEKGIQIFAPLFRKQKQEPEDVDLALDGEPVEITEPKEPAAKVLSGFRIVYVFDLSQTEGKPFEVPELQVNILQGATDWYENLRAVCPFEVIEATKEQLGGANGDFNRQTNRVRVEASMPEMQKTKTLIHEWGHGILHHKWATLPDRETRELEAESVAFVVAQSLGIDTSSYSFGYIAGWNGENAVDRLRTSASRIQSAAEQILSTLQKQQKAGLKEAV